MENVNQASVQTISTPHTLTQKSESKLAQEESFDVRKTHVVDYAEHKGLMINPSALDLLVSTNYVQVLDALVQDNLLVITEAHVQRKIQSLEVHAQTTISPSPEPFSQTPESVPAIKRAPRDDYSPNYKILSHLNYNGESVSKGKADDFLKLFQDKYNFLFGELNGRGYSAKPLNKMDRMGRDSDIDVVVMVSEKKNTKNGHVMLDIEDLEGQAKALIPASDAALIEKAKRLTVDDVIGMKVRLAKTGDLLIVKDFSWPDLPQRKPRTSEADLGMIVTSDIHIGSKLFLRNWFEKFISWMNLEVGSEKEKERVGKMKYLVIAGDCVDGVGVYPNQLGELEVKSINKQYEQFENYLLQLPENLEIFITPGNHDPCRWHDPQPPVLKEFVPKLYGMKNIHFLPSPSWVEIEDQKTLIYHGSGLIGAMDAMNIPPTKPEEAIKELLIKRDLMSVYGTKHPYAPEPKAYMLVREHPDVYIGGDNHYNAYTQYRGTTIINNGCWQLTSDYAASKGFIATPGRVPQFNFKTATLRESRFDKQQENAPVETAKEVGK